MWVAIDESVLQRDPDSRGPPAQCRGANWVVIEEKVLDRVPFVAAASC